MTKRPPHLARKINRALRCLPFMGAFRPARLLRKLNRSEGYRQAQPDPQLHAQIAAPCLTDQALLAELYQQIGLVPIASAAAASASKDGLRA